MHTPLHIKSNQVPQGHTILSVVVVHVGITQRPPRNQIAAHTDRHHLTNLAEHLIQLSFRHIGLQVANVQRSRHKLGGSRAGRGLGGLLLLHRNLSLRHD